MDGRSERGVNTVAGNLDTGEIHLYSDQGNDRERYSERRPAGGGEGSEYQ